MNPSNQSLLNGVIILDKQPGVTSAKAISLIKRKLNAKKIGHAGTLDPSATGILVCLLGKATKLATLFQEGKKEYQGIIKLGITTVSDDLDSEVLQIKPVSDFTEDDLRKIELSLTGEISQIPPRVSAIQIDGKRAYDMVRSGTFDEKAIAPRIVNIYSIILKKISNDQIYYTVECSRGTYVRSIARDIGAMLNCGAAIETLRRTKTDPFLINDAILLDNITVESIISMEQLTQGKNDILKEEICHH